MNIDLTGKYALVCGSSRGIGRATAYELASLGASVILFARNAEALKEVATSLPSVKGSTHTYLTADFNNTDSILEALSHLSHPVHILVNNSGGPPGGPVAAAEASEFEITFQRHLIANHTIVQRLLDGMKQAGYGRIINVISTSVKQPIPGLGVSNSIRAAVANWAKTLSIEVAPFGITVNNVLPGATDTDRISEILHAKALKTGKTIHELRQEMIDEIPAGRLAEPSETAAAIAFLASPAAAYINGINLPVDGGRTACL